MRVLALDATTRQGSVALADGDSIDERPGDQSRSHAARLPGELLALLDARRTTLDAVDLFAVASGPGSFTGLRIGIATIQGLSFVTGRPIVAVSTLDAVAHLAAAGAPSGTIVAAWIDAQRGEVFSALYTTADAPAFSPERLVTLDAPSVGVPGAILARWSSAHRDAPILFAGDGAARYPELLRARAVVNPPLLAGAIARIAIVRAARGETVNAAGVRPQYVRRPDAEIDRDRRATASAPQ